MSFTRMTLLRRRQDLSPAMFRDRYETGHRRIGERVLAGHATRYVRRYVEPIDGATAPDFDVVLEIDFPDRAAHDRWLTSLTAADIEEIAQDEETLFDRSATLSFTVQQCDSTLPTPIAGDRKEGEG